MLKLALELRDTFILSIMIKDILRGPIANGFQENTEFILDTLLFRLKKENSMKEFILKQIIDIKREITLKRVLVITVAMLIESLYVDGVLTICQ